MGFTSIDVVCTAISRKFSLLLHVLLLTFCFQTEFCALCRSPLHNRKNVALIIKPESKAKSQILPFFVQFEMFSNYVYYHYKTDDFKRPHFPLQFWYWIQVVSGIWNHAKIHQTISSSCDIKIWRNNFLMKSKGHNWGVWNWVNCDAKWSSISVKRIFW